jgi:competence protein ComEC
VIEPPAGRPLLVDTGAVRLAAASTSAREWWRRRCGRAASGRLSTLLITHGDPDHVGGASGVLASLPVGEAWLGIRVPRSESGNALLAELATRRMAVRYLRSAA